MIEAPTAARLQRTLELPALQRLNSILRLSWFLTDAQTRLQQSFALKPHRQQSRTNVFLNSQQSGHFPCLNIPKRW